MTLAKCGTEAGAVGTFEDRTLGADGPTTDHICRVAVAKARGLVGGARRLVL